MEGKVHGGREAFRDCLPGSGRTFHPILLAEQLGDHRDGRIPIVRNVDRSLRCVGQLISP